MSELQELSKDKRLRNHFNIDKKRRTNHHVQSSPHFHSYYEIYYMQEGSCRCFLENTVYNLERGHFLVIHPGEYHIVTYEQKGLHDRYTLYFDDQRLDESMKSYLRQKREDWVLPRHFMIREELEPEFLSLLARMLEFYRMNNDYGEMMLRYLFPVFLLYLWHNASPVTAAAKEDSLETGLQNAARFIGANYMRPITLKDAACEAGFTPTYFSKKFKELAGISFKDYLTHLRLKESVRLLRSTRMSIQEIAEACGFSGSNYFGDVFHSVYGVSPREYRKKEEV